MFDATMAFVGARLPELLLRFGEHVVLTGVSTTLAILGGIPLGIVAASRRHLRGPLLGAVGILQTIPSLAMLAILLVLIQKIGAVPAIIALTLYALLPIVRNTVAGLDGVAPETREAARGIGMTSRQQRWLVELPLARPVILAGIRTAAVVGVGVATLSAFIGAGGLGQFINRGLALADPRLILLGAVPAAILAMLVDLTLAAAQWGLEPVRHAPPRAWSACSRRMALCLPVVLLVLGVLAIPAGQRAGERPGAPRIRIATKNFTEQLILGELLAQLIEARTDLAVQRRFNLGGTMICHEALCRGEIDIYVEYLGTALIAILKEPPASDPDAALARVRAAYDERFGLDWLAPLGFNNTYALAVRAAEARERGWRSISDLVAVGPALRAGFTAEFAARPDGYPGLRQTYGLSLASVQDLDPALMYEALAQNEVDLICAFATDGRIAAYDLLTLTDDRGFFPPYNAAPVVRADVLAAHPTLAAVLQELGGQLDDAAMRRLNYAVDGRQRSPRQVARAFLEQAGLIE